MKKNRIPYTKPSITEKEVEYVTDAAKNGWGERCYEYIQRFEENFKDFTASRFAVATSSCTGALHLGMAALGIGPGDEVIIADINWIASAAPIVYLGAKPIFVDVLPDTWCLDPSKVEAAITPRTKAIVAVHLYGNLCAIKNLIELGSKYGVPIIEDGAEAIGSCWGEKHAGTLGIFGAFSFHGTKTMTTGEGGMLVTNDGELYEKVQTLNNHGRSKTQSRQFWPDLLGYKYKISNIQAALGCAQIERINDLINVKRQIFQFYRSRLENLPIDMNPEPVGTTNGYWMPTIIVQQGVKFDRETLLENFQKENIDGRVFFWPLSMLPMFEKKPENEVSYSLYVRAFNLPSYHDISEEDMDRVVRVVESSIGCS